MMDAIIGAGHNGLICGNYLTKAGLKVLVCERRMEPGGGLCTEEMTVPGFWHNVHSFFHRWVPGLPFYKDLELEKFGVRYLMPPVQSVAPFSDGALPTSLKKMQRSTGRYGIDMTR
jgi:phytoene dehydrogenase-like protein